VKHILVAGLLIVASPSFAQTPPAAPAEAQSQRRYQIRVLESVLVSAVQHAADTMSRRIQAVTPNIVLMTDTARARGFLLPDYGVFFDVEVPGLPLSLAWTMRIMDRDFDVTSSLDLVRRSLETIPDLAARREAEQALKRIELEVAPPPVTAPDVAGGRPADTVRTATAAVTPAEVRERQAAPSQDPNEAYTEVVKNALIDVMLDYSGPMGIAADEWLTIAARDAHGPAFPGEAYDASTIVLRVRGSDLADFRAERISREEARKRVEVREF
jgi:hypothetical protein